MLKEQLDELTKFYSDSKDATSKLRLYLQTTQDELAFIYRMRNKIAHDGNSNHPLLESVCKKAGNHAISFFHQVIQQVSGDNGLKLDEILMSFVHQYDLTELQLSESKKPIDIFL